MGSSLLAAAFLIFVARPASVFVSLFFTRMSLREKTLVSWVGLRGAVPIVLATFPLLAGIPKAELIFNLVFFIVLTSVLLQGTTIPRSRNGSASTPRSTGGPSIFWTSPRPAI